MQGQTASFRGDTLSQLGREVGRCSVLKRLRDVAPEARQDFGAEKSMIFGRGIGHRVLGFGYAGFG